MTRPLAALALAWGAIAFAGCGDDDEDGDEAQAPPATERAASATDAAAVAALIEEAAATRNTDSCARLATIAFLEQTERFPGQRALVSCQFELTDRGLLDEPLEVGSVEIEADGTAVAEVAYGAGSRKAGLTALVRVEEGKLAAVDDYVRADRADLERALRNEMITGPLAIPKGAADCAVARLRSLGDAAFEIFLLRAGIGTFYSPALTCAREPLVDRKLGTVSRRFPYLRPAALRCARGRLLALRAPPLAKAIADRLHRAAGRTAIACDPEGAISGYRRFLAEPPRGESPRVTACVSGRLRGRTPAALARTLLVEGTEDILDSCRAAAK